MPPARRSTPSPAPATATRRGDGEAPRRRTYRLRRRAEAQQRTRQRIVEAIVALHEDVGPARTTISAIAQRAGVERLTVYRHFPDELSQFVACSAHWQELHPAPDPAEWVGITDPRRRLRAGLEAIYGYYQRGEAMLSRIMRDAPELPPLREVMKPFEQYLAAVVQALAEPWEASGGDPRLIRAAVAHAAGFGTWQSLEGHGLARDEAVDLMTRLVAAAAERR